MLSRFYYCIGIAFIGVWWYAAFSHTQSTHNTMLFPIKTTASSLNVTHLASIERDVLHKALAGDVDLMTRLIADWDVDAQLLKLTGYKQAHRFPKKKYLRSQILGRQLLLNNIPGSKKKVLPQTYVAASFLLALADPGQIIALPTGLRNHTQLFSKNLTDAIPFDLDRYTAETLYLIRPEIAFVAHYSDPWLMQTLKNQNTALAVLKGSNNLEDIHNELRWTGILAGQPLKAEMLSLFMEAAMQAIDNRLLLVQNHLQEHHLAKRILLVNYHQQFFLPSENTLSYQLLKRLNAGDLFLQDCTENKRLCPINNEQLIHLDPCCLIISTSSIEDAKRFIIQNNALVHLAAWQDERIFLIDETVQQFPSQYFVLAYYDIAQALLQSKFL